jgi:hypothetical protein
LSNNLNPHVDLKVVSRIWETENTNPEVLREVLRAGRRRHPEVTALLCNDWAGICATETFSVPEELSVVGFGGTPEGAASHPPLTTVAIRDADAVALWGCTSLISQIQTIQSGRPPKPPTQAMLMPDLVLRKSTKALVSRKVAAKNLQQPIREKLDPAGTWRNIYPFLKRRGTHHWLQLKLSTLANHNFSRHHGWLGAEPLEHFPPGLRSIHGVPFQILDERQNEGRAVITFRSPHSHSAGQEDLPITVKMKLNSRVKALYFLHGCGHAKPIPFAEYIMHYKRGEAARVTLIPMGPSRSLAQELLGDLKPNLQDWWPDPYQPENFPHAHHVTVFNPAEPELYERSLYSLEWLNPRPDDEVDFIEVRVAPEAGPTLALIAVTALLAED